jgi:outer membrane protein assembly factor BamB
MRVYWLAFSGLMCMGGGSAMADDWPQWRGAKRDAVSQETGLLKSWPKEGPKLLWSVKDIGNGYGSVTVAGGKIYLVGNKGLENEFVSALDAKNGKELWSTKLGVVGNPKQVPSYPAARTTPTLDGGLLYAMGSDGDLVCVDAANGKEKWRKSLQKDFGAKAGVWAFSESPLIDGNRVIVAPGTEAATVVALDKKTGATIWKASVPGNQLAAYSSAIPINSGGVRQIAAYVQKGLVGLDSATGKVLWTYDKTLDKQFGVHAVTPVVSGDLVYVSSAAGGGVAQIKSSGGAVTADSLYVQRKAPMALGGSVRVGDYLYGANTTLLLCTELATGKVLWEDRCVGAASVCYADGRLYLHGENGEVALVEATPTGYKELGRFTPPDPPARGTAKSWNYPVISNGRLYIRDLGSLYVYDIKG